MGAAVRDCHSCTKVHSMAVKTWQLSFHCASVIATFLCTSLRSSHNSTTSHKPVLSNGPDLPPPRMGAWTFTVLLNTGVSLCLSVCLRILPSKHCGTVADSVWHMGIAAKWLVTSYSVTNSASCYVMFSRV